MDEYKERLIRQLKFKCKDLRQELSETQGIYQKAVLGFCAHIDSFCRDKGLQNPLEALARKNKPPHAAEEEAYIAETLTEEQKKQLPSQFKKIFASIVYQTHPDKAQNTDSQETYQEAVEAKNKNQVGSLVSLAQDLKIDISHLSYAAIREIESQIEKMESDIDSIHRSYPWAWYYAPLPKKENIIEMFCEHS